MTHTENRKPGFAFRRPSPAVYRCIFAALSLFLLIALIYANSLDGEWHFDDFENIVDNADIHVKNLSPSAMENSLYLKGRLSRPLSRLSFALNYYRCGLHVWCYHVTNLVIHWLCAVFLFLFIYDMLRLSSLKERFEGNAYAIALIATFLWAINPVQVLAVSYIVQRMASMAGMFYIISLYCYLRGRMSGEKGRSVMLFTGSALSGICALASKENAAMLPFAMLMIELFIIGGPTRQRSVRIAAIWAVPLVVYTAVLLWAVDLPSVLSGYALRPFTLAERLLTEPRVMVFYMTLLLYPSSLRLTMLHDMEVSTSLLNPWTTLPSILIVLTLIVYALRSAGKRPLIAFCLVFFFLNHLIEGTVIPLQIVFEYRNYIPSFFFFVPVAILFLGIMEYFSSSPPVKALVVVCMVGIMVAWGHTVYVRNQTLKDNLSLWYDNARKAPRLSLVHNNLGIAFQNLGFARDAWREISLAAELDRFNLLRNAALVQYNLGQLLLNRGDTDGARLHYDKALDLRPGYALALSGIAMAKLIEGKESEALDWMTKALKADPREISRDPYAGIVFLRCGLPERAEAAAREARAHGRDRLIPLMIMAQTARARGDEAGAIRLWEEYRSSRPRSLGATFALIELYHATGQEDRLDGVVKDLAVLRGWMDIPSTLRRYHNTIEALIYRPDLEQVLSIAAEAGRTSADDGGRNRAKRSGRARQ